MDYDKLAKKFGGSESSGGIDYDSLATKFGGSTEPEYTPPKPSTLASVGRGMMDVAQGIKQIGLQAGEAIGLADQGSADAYRKNVQDEIALYERGAGPGIDAGRIGGNLVATLPTALIPGMAAPSLLTRTASSAAGGALASGAQFVPEGQSRLDNILMGGTLGAVIPAALQKGGEAAKKVIDNKAQQKIADFVKNRTLQQGQQLGLKVPPSSVNPSTTNQLLEGLSGKIKTEQSASLANRDVANKVAKDYLGIASDEPLTPELLNTLRSQYGQAYENVRGAGQILADTDFKNALSNISKTNTSIEKDFPGLASQDITGLVKNLDKKSFDANSAIDVISILRNNADKAYRTGDNAIGKANRDAAKAVEDLLERQLTKSGYDSNAVNAFRDARQNIAKTYSIQKAMNAETGDIDASKLAKQLNAGKPLTGDIKTVAEFANAFPKATQNVKGSVTALSPLDYAAGGISAASSGNPLALAAVAARPAVRKLLLSDFYQNRFAKLQNDPSALQKIAPVLLDAEAVKRLTPQGLATLFAGTSQGSD
jgi:hypothetical protein